MTKEVRPEPTIPDHKVYRKIGGGSYGEVWLAEGVTGVLRAVKVVRRDDFDDEKTFEREFEGIRKYEPVSRDHPGLVKIFHIGRAEQDGVPFYYYVMELGDDIRTGRDINPVEYEARTLRSDMLSADSSPLDVDFCIEAGRALSEGLEHLHQAGLAHRDVKPANVIFVDGNAKMADIGLVALRDQRTFVGTEGFVPPEGPGSAQADVYSLGKVLYEMATGKDRLDFPELPDELPEGKERKRWRALNAVICDVCEPRLSKRKIKTAGEMAGELTRLQRGQRRAVKIGKSAAFGALALLVGALLVWQYPVIVSSLAKNSDDQSELPEELPSVSVRITSSPLGAEVYDETGRYIADTPLENRTYPLGTELEYSFRMQGFHPKRLITKITEEVIEEGLLVIAPILEIYAPPLDGDPWEDVLGATYKGVENYHISNYYVSKFSWQAYRGETKDKAGVFVKVSENGREREVVFCTEQAANRFSDWLQDKSQEGYLTVDHEMEAVMDHASSFQGVDEEILKKGIRPFRMLVRRIPYARLQITSEPSGADVYLGGQWRGVTPLLGDPSGEGIKVNPEITDLVLEREGYERERVTLNLSKDEAWNEPMHFTLRQSAGVIFGQEWTNSLGMKFVPVNESLMASVWETRVKDYRAYLRAAKVRWPQSTEPEFKQGPEHPIVFVSPDDARGFCQWLTEVEREKGLVSSNHNYRLPTDAEWSEMVGLSLEFGDLPFERGSWPSEIYPWGGWPPEIGSGNYADDTAVADGAVQGAKSIGGYEDGFAYTAPVGSFQPNVLGIYDLGGNVHEWVEDWYSAQKKYKVTRGAGWTSFQQHTLDSSFRNFVDQETGVYDSKYGFRVVLSRDAQVSEENSSEDGDLDE